MNKISFIRAAIVGILLMTSSVTPVLAQTGGYYLYEYTYYSDSSHTQLVGILSEHCYEPATLSGEVTQYYTRVRSGYYSYSEGCVEY